MALAESARSLLDPRLVIAIALGDTDGMAIMDGGTYDPFNNFVHSRESGRYAPYLLVEAGPRIRVVPDPPIAFADPEPDQAELQSGAIRIRIRNDPKVFCWRVKVNGLELTPSYSPEINRLMLEILGIEEIPVLVVKDTAGLSFIKGEKKILNYVRNACFNQQPVLYFDQSLHPAGEEMTVLTEDGGECTLDIDCNDQ